MANNIPEYRDATELIRDHFRNEASEFNGQHELFMEFVGEWVYAAYLQGHEDGYLQGETDGFNTGREEGEQVGYDEGYEDARAEFDSDD